MKNESQEQQVKMILKRMTLALALAAALIPRGFAGADVPKADRANKPSASVKSDFLNVGEKLNYEVSWSSFLIAGELTIETKDRRSFEGVEGYHVSAQARSVGLVSAVVYKVNDVYESFLDAGTLQPFRADKRSRHGKKTSESSVILDQAKRTAKLSSGKTIAIPPDTYDLAGLVYAVRSMDLSAGKSRTFTLLEDEKLYTIKVEVEGREKVTTKAGEFDAVRISTLRLREGEAKDPYNLRFFVTTDPRRLPVLITAEPSWGGVRVELTSFSGTRGESKR